VAKSRDIKIYTLALIEEVERERRWPDLERSGSTDSMAEVMLFRFLSNERECGPDPDDERPDNCMSSVSDMTLQSSLGGPPVEGRTKSETGTLSRVGTGSSVSLSPVLLMSVYAYSKSR
jgi:hypothetical protein